LGDNDDDCVDGAICFRPMVFFDVRIEEKKNASWRDKGQCTWGI